MSMAVAAVVVAAAADGDGADDFDGNDAPVDDTLVVQLVAAKVQLTKTMMVHRWMTMMKRTTAVLEADG
uniref:Putative secreted protein n=1 Tax=Anopheles triannulatus TaxID=58253 RepID=A0A2M4B7R1_9DIPT